MDGIIRCADCRLVHPAAKLLRPRTAVHQPLLEPCRQKRRLARRAEQATNIRPAERREAGFHLRALVRVGRVQIRIRVENRIRALVQQDQRGVVVGLIEKVVMDPLRERAAVVDVFRLRVGGPGAKRRHASLQHQPFIPRVQIIDSGGSGAIELLDDRRVDGNRLPEELGDIRAGETAGDIATEQRSGRDLAPDRGPMEGREAIEIRNGRLRYGRRGISGERHVARQRLPVQLDHFPGRIGAAERRRRGSIPSRCESAPSI